MQYIVLDASLGAPLSLLRKPSALWPAVPPGGILRRGMDGGPVTVFPSRKAALAAIQRTLAYDTGRSCELEMSVSRLVS